MPASLEPAHFAAVTCATAGKWSQAVEMGQRWRDASAGNTLVTDELIASSYVAQGNLTAARDQLATYVAAAKGDPAKYRSIIAQYAQLQAAVVSPEAAAEILRPRLSEDAGWRIDWMNIAAQNLDAAHAVAWLNEVEPHLKSGDIEEELALAQSWHVLAQKTHDPAHVQRTAAMLSRVTAAAQHNPTSANADIVLGSLNEVAGDIAAAETFYRKALQQDPQSVVAQNNLAMLLARKSDHLDEALSLAQQAVHSGGIVAPRSMTRSHSCRDSAAIILRVSPRFRKRSSSPRCP